MVRLSTASSSTSSSANSSAPSIDDADMAAGQHLQRQQQHQQKLFQQQQLQKRPSTASSGMTSLDQQSNNSNNNNKQDEQIIPIAPYYYETPPMSSGASSMTSSTSMTSIASAMSINGRPEDHPSDLEFFEDLVSEPVLVLGVDISHLSRQYQFIVCAIGVFGFSLLYGYLQELISVQLCNRQLGLFLAMMQFSGYTLLAYILRNFVYSRQSKDPYYMNKKASLAKQKQKEQSLLPSFDNSRGYNIDHSHSDSLLKVPLHLYLGLSLLRAIDLGMTNLAMQYINYPAKTLMKSSRVVFTMIFGVVIARKTYHLTDYAIVCCMVAGLALFMHADANSSAVFDLSGVAMLTVSLLCDGAISNMSESIMTTFGVGQDEFIFRMYSIALVAITFAAAVKGDLREGLFWMTQPGTYDELLSASPNVERTWSVGAKITVMVLFSSMGFFGSSCSAAITKNFGALTMSITSTARKATTLFLSFFLFNNVCTLEHLLGVFIFITALTAKSLRRRKDGNKKNSNKTRRKKKSSSSRTTKRINEQWKHTMEQHGYSDNNNSNNNALPSSMESMAMASGLAANSTPTSSSGPAQATGGATAAAAVAPLDVVLNSSNNEHGSPSPARSLGMTQRHRSHPPPPKRGGGSSISRESPKLAHVV